MGGLAFFDALLLAPVPQRQRQHLPAAHPPWDAPRLLLLLLLLLRQCQPGPLPHCAVDRVPCVGQFLGGRLLAQPGLATPDLRHHHCC